MTKQPTSHFSLSDLRMSITEHEQPLFTLTKAEMEAMVSRIEAARVLIMNMCVNSDDENLRAKQWLASLEREGNK